MTRVEENEKLQEWFNGQIGKKYDSTEKAKCDSIGVIASVLMDISKSLAIIADKAADKEATTKIDLVVRQLREEAEYAYADFDEYKAETLGADADELPDDEFRYGLERAIEVIKAAVKEQK